MHSSSAHPRGSSTRQRVAKTAVFVLPLQPTGTLFNARTKQDSDCHVCPLCELSSVPFKRSMVRILLLMLVLCAAAPKHLSCSCRLNYLAREVSAQVLTEATAVELFAAFTCPHVRWIAPAVLLYHFCGTAAHFACLPYMAHVSSKKK